MTLHKTVDIVDDVDIVDKAILDTGTERMHFWFLKFMVWAGLRVEHYGLIILVPIQMRWELAVGWNPNH